MDIIVDIETDAVIILLESSDLVRLTLIDICTICLGILNVTGSIIGCHALVHDPVPVGSARLQSVYFYLMDLSNWIDSVSTGIVILISFLIVEMSTIIGSNLYPGYSIHISGPDDSKSSLTHTLDIWTADSLRSKLVLS